MRRAECLGRLEALTLLAQSPPNRLKEKPMNAPAKSSDSLAIEARDAVRTQRTFFRTRATLDVGFRIAQLEKLLGLVKAHEDELHAAIRADFGRSVPATQMMEIFPLYEELQHAIDNVRRLAAPRAVQTNAINVPARSLVVPEPLGTSLVIGAWNFPYNLSLVPVVGSGAPARP
ncbi:MAG: aldehyde dehydrogenase family protein [Planctomycetota bacterium]